MQSPIYMSRFVKCSEKLLLQIKNVPKYYKRTYLSNAYLCEEEWNKRYNSPLLKQVNLDDMFFEIEKKFQSQGKVSAVDIDIYANLMSTESNVDEIMTLLDIVRLTTEASNILPSTHHAVIRFLMKLNLTESLFEILNDRTKYGIFPDALCYNFMMDTFLEKKDYASAARVAALLMLQEDYSNPISNAMALYSCHRYLENPDEWKAPVIVKDEPEEVVKIRVKYLREPFFDDHFDLTEPSDLVGKTLSLYGKHIGNAEGRSCQLRGLFLYKKYHDILQLLDKWMKEIPSDIVYKEVIPLIQKDVAPIFEGEMKPHEKKLTLLLEELSNKNLKKGSLTEVLENNIKSAIEKQEKIDIEQQCKDYNDWEEKRLKVLQEHLAEVNRQEKKKEFAETKKDIEDREQILTYFDNQDQIELKIHRKLAEEKKKYRRVPKSKTIEDENYVPPDIHHLRNQKRS